MHSLREKIVQWDQRTMKSIAVLRRPFLTKILSFVSYSGTSIVWLTIVAILWVLQLSGFGFLPKGELFLKCMIPAGIAWGIGNIIKAYFKRPRPFQEMENFKSMVSPPGHFDSFPSNHAATTSAFLTCLVFIGHPLALIVFLWWFSILCSRLYLGVHYPTDIFAGTFLGLLIGYSFFTLMNFI